MNPGAVILIIVIVAVVIYLAVKAAQAAAERERQRLAGLAEWAAANGFQFSPADGWNLDGRFGGVGDIGLSAGHDRYAFEVLSRPDPVPIWLFRYHYRTWETRTVTHTDSKGHAHTRTERYEEDHWRQYLIVELGAQFPSFSLRHENWLDKVASFFGAHDINFESAEFSRRYHCKSDDAEFAYAVVNEQMMEFLLPLRFRVQLTGGLLVMDAQRFGYAAAGWQEAYAEAAGFVNRILPFVWQDYGKRPPLKLPEPRPVAPISQLAPAGRPA